MAAMTALTSRYGVEPVSLIEISWTDGNQSLYADRDVEGIPGRIVEISGLDATIKVDGNSDSIEMQVTVDDTDGSLKALLDTIDVHFRPVAFYQWIKGTSIDTDRFVIFRGAVNSPVKWSEHQRTVSFSVINKIEDAEVGFSVEEGFFGAVQSELIGKPWPLCFGTVLNMPTLLTSQSVRGVLLNGTGIRDITLDCQKANIAQCPSTQVFVQGFAGPQGFTDPACVQARCAQLQEIDLKISQQDALQTDLLIYHGDLFPQGVTIQIAINGALFTGRFEGQIFRVFNRTHPDWLTVSPVQEIVHSNCGKEQIADQCYGLPVQSSSFFWAPPGSKVDLGAGDPLVYACNLIPSTILGVSAKFSYDGKTAMTVVPLSYYTIRETDYGSYQVMEIVLPKRLSLIDPGWEDDLYVTLASDVGPNTVDILQWLIEKYTKFDIDTDSFSHVRTLVDNYPSNFAITDRKNIVEVLSNIAYQARCALWLRNDKIVIRYLPEDPTSNDTITDADIVSDSLELDHTSTDDLATKLTATWREDYSVETPNQLIIRNNVEKYGLHEDERDYYIYNIQTYVNKGNSFWAVRRSNIWRRAIFSTGLHKAALEILDIVTLDLPQISNDPVKGIVEKATINWDQSTIDFEVWLPILAGSRDQYVFAWPADIAVTVTYPDPVVNGSSPPGFSVVAPIEQAQSSGPPNQFSISAGCGAVDTDLFEIDACKKDQPKKKQSDRDDEKETPKTKGGNSPGDGSSQKAAQASKDASIRQNPYVPTTNSPADPNAGGGGGGGGGGDGEGDDGQTPAQKALEKELNKLPKKGPNDCGTIVTVAWFQNTLTPNGLGCEPVTPPQIETFHFGSSGGASSFASNVTGVFNSNNAEQCSVPPCPPCVTVTQISGPDCDPAKYDPGIIAHETTGADGQPIPRTVLNTHAA
jgi:hypothetical protein